MKLHVVLRDQHNVLFMIGNISAHVKPINDKYQIFIKIRISIIDP
jgi:hypothetical protein